jgi:hypothetical protein
MTLVDKLTDHAFEKRRGSLDLLRLAFNLAMGTRCEVITAQIHTQVLTDLDLGLDQAKLSRNCVTIRANTTPRDLTS